MEIPQKAIDPCKVAVYIRWSTEDQGEGTTLDVQMDGCRHYAISQGWTVAESLTFIDDGYSGGNLNRPALTRLREAVARGDVECVVVFKLDRLSRDVPDMIKLIMEEWNGLCVVKSAREPVDTTTQTGKMFFYTLASYAEWERSVIRDRTFSGKLRRAQEGRNPGVQPCYGYTYGDDPGTFKIVPHEAEVVRRIFSMYRMGLGGTRIASTLNEEQVPSRYGTGWNASTVKWLLRNPAFVGRLVFGQTSINSKTKKRSKNQRPHLEREGLYPPIVSIEEWELVQQIRQTRPGPATKTSGRNHSSSHLLTGLLRCGKCGRCLRASQGTGAPTPDGKYHYYACETLQSYGKAACSARRIRQEALDQIVVGKVRDLYGDALRRKAYAERVLGKMAREEVTVKGALGEFETALAKIEAKRKKLRALVLEDSLTAADYRAFVQDVEDEARGLEERRARLQSRLITLGAAQSEHVGLLKTMELLDEWDALSKPQRKELLRSFISRIEAYLPKGGHELTVNITWQLAEDQGDGETMTLVV